ncbi:sugar phosphate isomerase/epimerase family protein [Candidatus Poribacteria bacterium]
MILGIGSYTYAWAVGVPDHSPSSPLTAMGLLDKADDLGVRLVQIADNMPLDRLSDSELDTFKKRAHDLRISIEVGTRGIAYDHLRAYLQLAQRLRSPILRLVVDTADHQPAEDEVIDAVKAIIPEFERADVCLAIENHDRFVSRTLAYILERVGSDHIGICLDTVNSFGALEGPKVVLDTLGPWVVNLHVKDFSIHRASHMLGFTIEGQPAGQGRLDVPWLIQELRAHDRDPNAILELWTPPEETLEETIAREDRWAAASVEYLRQLIPD